MNVLYSDVLSSVRFTSHVITEYGKASRNEMLSYIFVDLS